jgi:hypothetical protein
MLIPGAMDDPKMRGSRAFPGALAAMAAAYLFLFAYYFAATMIRRPYWDMFSYITDYLDYRRSGEFLRYLWSQYGGTEHRQVWMRLLTAIDIGVFHGVAYPFMVFASACLLSMPLLMGREILRAGLQPMLGLTGAWLALLLVLTTVNVVDCSLPIEGIYPQTAAFAVLSFILFNGSGADRRMAFWQRLAGMAAAAGAGLASAGGLIVWPILVWSAWRSAAGWRWMAGTALAGALFTAAYLHGIAFHGSTAAALQGSNEFYQPQHLVKIIDTLATFLGLPWTRLAAFALAGRVLGLALLMLGVIVIIRRGIMGPRREDGFGRLERISLCLILFSLGTAAAAAIGRVGTEVDGFLPVRYSVLMAPLHLGLLGLALIWLKQRWERLAMRHLVQAAALGLGAMLLIQQVAAGEVAAGRTREIRAAISDLMADRGDPAQVEKIVGRLVVVRPIVEEMRRQQIYIGVE